MSPMAKCPLYSTNCGIDCNFERSHSDKDQLLAAALCLIIYLVPDCIGFPFSKTYKVHRARKASLGAKKHNLICPGLAEEEVGRLPGQKGTKKRPSHKVN